MFACAHRCSRARRGRCVNVVECSSAFGRRRLPVLDLYGAIIAGVRPDVLGNFDEAATRAALEPDAFRAEVAALREAGDDISEGVARQARVR